MRRAMLLGLLLVSAVTWADVASETRKLQDVDLAVRREAVKALVAMDDAGAWRALSNTYSTQPSEVRAAILRQTPVLFDRFRKIVENTPKYQELEAISQQIKAELDEVIKQLEDSPTKEQIDRLRTKVDDLQKRIPSETGDKLYDDVGYMGLGLLRKGAVESEPEVKSAGSEAIVRSGLRHFRADRATFATCGTGRWYFGELWEDLSKLVKEEARRNPDPFIAAAKAGGDDYEKASLILADVKSPESIKLTRRQLLSKDPEVVDVGLGCVTQWPRNEYLPLLMGILARTEYGSADADLTFALEGYGALGPATIRGSWSRFLQPAKLRALALVNRYGCRSAFELATGALQDRDEEVRSSGLETMKYVLDAQWDEESSGPDPKDLTEKDRAFFTRTTLRSLEDASPLVRSKALQLLEPEDISLDVAESFVRDPSPEIRAAVARLLGEYRDARLISPLMVLLGDLEGDVRAASAYALKNLPELAFLPIKRGLKDKNSVLRGECAKLMANYKDPSLVGDLAPLVKDREMQIRLAALRSLATFEGAAVKAILPALRDEVSGIRWEAIKILAAIPGPEGIDGLRQALKFALESDRDQVQKALNRRLSG